MDVAAELGICFTRAVSDARRWLIMPNPSLLGWHYELSGGSGKLLGYPSRVESPKGSNVPIVTLRFDDSNSFMKKYSD